MLPIDKVEAILSPYGLELTENGTRVKSKKFEFGTVSIEIIYEMMFIHDVPRDQALKDIAMLLNVSKPSDKYDPKTVKKKKVFGS